MKRTFMVVLSVLILQYPSRLPAELTNSWTNSLSSSWQTAASWSLGQAASNNQSAVLITNDTSKTVTIDAPTSGSFPGTLVISNLSLSAPGTAVNTLSLSNAGVATPLRILNSFTISSGGSLTITNSALAVEGLSGIDTFNLDGSGRLDSGALFTTNVNTLIGFGANGQMTVAGGTWQAVSIYDGVQGANQGILTIAGGTTTLSGVLTVGDSSTLATGSVWLTGGQLTVSNMTWIGNWGVGRMVVSGGVWQATTVEVGYWGPSRGMLTIAGGTSTLTDPLVLGHFANSTGTVWLTGGQLAVANDPTYVGFSGVGNLTVSNATWSAQDIIVARNTSAKGALTLEGGTVTAANLIATNANSVVSFHNGAFTTQGATVSNGSVFVVGNGTAAAAWNLQGGLHSLANGLTVNTNASLSGAGTISIGLSNPVLNNGSFTATNGTLTIATAGAVTAGGFQNRPTGAVTISSDGSLVLQRSEAGWTSGVMPTNSGTISLNGGTLKGTNSTGAALGKFVNAAGATIQGSGGTITGFGALENSGTLKCAGAQWWWIGTEIVGLDLNLPSGVITANTANVSFRGGLNNAGLLSAVASTVNVAQAWANAGTINLQDSRILGGTLTNSGVVMVGGDNESGVAGLVNLPGGKVTVGSGEFRFSGGLDQQGDLDIVWSYVRNRPHARYDPMGLDRPPNTGKITLGDGDFSFVPALTNQGTITGYGTLSGSGTLVNHAGGLIEATGGPLVISNAFIQNGRILVQNGATLLVVPEWQNGGTVTMNGGVISGGTLTNALQMSGTGTVSANYVQVAGAELNVGAGTLTFEGQVTAKGGTIRPNGGYMVSSFFDINVDTNAQVIMNGGGIIAPGLNNLGTFSAFGTVNALIFTNSGYLYTSGILTADVWTVVNDKHLELFFDWIQSPFMLVNQGTVNIYGAALVSGITNYDQIIGWGTLSGNMLNNAASGVILATNRDIPLVLNSLVTANSGIVTANMAKLISNGAFQNNGTFVAISSVGTFNGVVVNNGKWIMDPSTNVFTAAYTNDTSGVIQMVAGDVFIFTNTVSSSGHFINRSTNNVANHLSGGKFLFSGTLMVTQDFFTAAHNREDLLPSVDSTNTIVLADWSPWTAATTTNFFLGTLEISNFSTVGVWDAFTNLEGSPGTNDNLRAALYVDNLWMGANSMLIIGTNTEVYFLNSNTWSTLNFALLDGPAEFGGELHQVIVTGMPGAVPEPSVVLLGLGGAALVYIRRRLRK